MQPERHRLLQRQLKRYIKDLDDISLEWQQFLVAVNDAYTQADDDRLRLERMLELSSQELLAANTDLQQVLTSVEQQVSDRTTELTRSNVELAETLQQLQQAQLQLIQVEKMSSLGQMVAGVAHELNNPVTFIYGNLKYVMQYMQDLLQVVQLYQVAYPTPAASVQTVLVDVDFAFIATDLPKVLGSMTTGTQRIAQIVQALRTFSRLDEAEVKQVNIHECLESTLMLLTGQLDLDHGPIAIVQNYADLPLVECYAGQLNQVFLSILTNAIDALKGASKFTDKKFTDNMLAISNVGEIAGALKAIETAFLQTYSTPVIQITTRLTEGGAFEVQILDNADGIPLAIRDRLFDPFFTTKAVGSGIGMGLSTSYQVVAKLHGGDLICRSTPGLGTAFVIQIPL
jgi:two-component system, NtrC family, sensor kinase